MTQKEELQEILDKWNDFAIPLGLIKRKTRLTPKRIKHFAARCSEGFVECFNDILGEIKVSDFLRGKINQDGKYVNWKITIDAILERQTLWQKIYEGNYSNKSSQESLSLDELMEENETH